MKPLSIRIALVFTAFAAIACESAEAPPRDATSATPKPEAPPAWLDEVAKRCALAASCAHAHDAPRFLDASACVSAFAQRFARGDAKDAIYTCLGNARTCDAAAACMHQGHDARATAYCVSHPGAGSACDGDTLIACGGDDPDESESASCAAIGASCKEFAQAGGLLDHACFSAQTCPHGITESRCENDHTLVACHDGAVEKIVCAPGTKCDSHEERPGEHAASCEAQGGTRCSTNEEKKCDGDTLVECVSHGHAGSVRVTDCAAAGLRCAGKGERAGCYVPVKTDCEPGPATCDGAALSFCAAGKMMHVSCTHLGLGACNPSANGPNAACVVPSTR